MSPNVSHGRVSTNEVEEHHKLGLNKGEGVNCFHKQHKKGMFVEIIMIKND